MTQKAERTRRPPKLWTTSWLLAGMCVLCHAADSRAQTATLTATLDATLIEAPAGEFANGAGPALFVGRTSASSGARRRALLFFDVAGALPAGASVESAELTLVLTPSNRPVTNVTVHRVLSAWSEGTSSASGGGGAPSEPGDTTWIHTHYDNEFWTTPGADFVPVASSLTPVAGPGVYLWGSTPGLVADVQSWLDEPASNHGWLLIGDEGSPTTAKRFVSRESPADAVHPQLIVTYRLTCESADLPRGAYGLCHAYCEALDCDATHPRGTQRACSRLASHFARRTDGATLPCESHLVP